MNLGPLLAATEDLPVFELYAGCSPAPQASCVGRLRPGSS